MLRSLNGAWWTFIFSLKACARVKFHSGWPLGPLTPVSNKLTSSSHLTVLLPKVPNQTEETHPSYSD